MCSGNPGLREGKKRLVSVITALAMLMSCFMVIGAGAAFANDEEISPLDDYFDFYYFPKGGDYNNDWGFASASEWEIDLDSVVNENPQVAVMRKAVYDEGDASYVFDVKGVGKTVMTFKARPVNAAEYTDYNVTIETEKYVCPVKSFKIGKKDYASKFKKIDWADQGKTISGKVNVKAKKGWKLVKIIFYDMSKDKDIKIKNNTKVKIEKGDCVWAEFKKGSTRMRCTVGVWE